MADTSGPVEPTGDWTDAGGWSNEMFDGFTAGMADELRRLSKWRLIGPIQFLLAREYEQLGLSAGPVRAVLPGSYRRGIVLGILVVTDEDVVAYGWRGNSKESVVIAKEWISGIDLRWRLSSGRLTIHLHDSDGKHEEEMKFKGSMATAETAERWRSAALYLPGSS